MSDNEEGTYDLCRPQAIRHKRAAMFALLAEAREVSNPELAERLGFRLDGKERRVLNDLKLVISEKHGRAYSHQLTDAGWRWCNEELSASPGDSRRGARRSSERGFYNTPCRSSPVSRVHRAEPRRHLPQHK